jgi:hypothetical protein
MPKVMVDYSNTIIYKIFCNDTNISDIYIGHTTNFIKRKYQHKILSNGNKKLKIYDVIRKNGGWENWNMVEIAKYNCQDSTEAKIREQEHYDLLKPTLNSVNPISSNEYCVLSIDNGITHIEDNLHTESIKHKSNTHPEFYCGKCNFKCSKKYTCNVCNYNTDKKCNYDTHLISMRHVRATEVYRKRQNSAKIQPSQDVKINEFSCLCGKTYISRQSLWRHKKICLQNNAPIDENIGNALVSIDDKDDLIIQLLKQNAKLMEILENGTMNNSHNTTNSHNKAFNLNFFLNETCKNAMNITDFVDSIKLQLSDFMKMGEVGFVEGISNIIVKNLNSLDETVRPIHCTDQKRETFYLKDKNIWEKDDEEQKKMKQMIKSISYKNEKLMKTYKETYPDYNDPDSRRSDQYSKIMVEAMDCKEESREKIIKNISKATTIKHK